MIGLRHTLQVGDHGQCEGLGERGDQLASAAVDEAVEQRVGVLPHELFVRAQAARGDESHQQVALRGVVRRVEAGNLVAERELVAAGHDDVGDVIARYRLRELHERPADGVAGRVGPRGRLMLGKGGGVAVDLLGLGMAGDHVGAVVGLLPDRALRAHPVEVRIRVRLDRRVLEEVDGGEVGHTSSTPPAALHPSRLRRRGVCWVLACLAAM